MGDVQVAHKASARLVTNRKEPWEGERREAKRVSPVFSFPPPFSRKFLSRERERERERETVYVRGTEFTLPNFSEV